MLKELQRAKAHQRYIQINYLGGYGQNTQRNLKLIEFAGDRLKVYCLTRMAPRVFAIGNCDPAGGDWTCYLTSSEKCCA